MARYYMLLPADGWPNWVLGNHDKPRIASRVGLRQARVAAMLLLTLRGTPTLYYGDEIGMQNGAITAEQVRDPYEKNVPGLGLGRDPERTPMQWDATRHGGFSNHPPWLPVAGDYRAVNVAAEASQTDALLTLYQRLIALRRAEPALSVGEFALLPSRGNVLAYVREAGDRKLLIILNLGAGLESFDLSGWNTNARLLLSTDSARKDQLFSGTIELRPDEGVVTELF
jgi:alpha-glucosidase